MDLHRQVVHVGAGREVLFDYLVLATGSENNYFLAATAAAVLRARRTARRESAEGGNASRMREAPARG